MDSELPPSGQVRLPEQNLRFPLPMGWMPLLVLVTAIIYGLLAVFFLRPEIRDALPPSSAPEATTSGPETKLVHTDYLVAPLGRVLENRLWKNRNWAPATAQYSGVGYINAPVTFRVVVDNPRDTPAEEWLVVSAPFLDLIQPAMLDSQGRYTLLPAMGDQYPFANRLVALPQWIWPVTLPPGKTTLLFEVHSDGPSMLPLSIHAPEVVVADSTKTLAWRTFLTGLLTFALVFNLTIAVRLKRPGLAWLSVVMSSLIYSQLVMEGLGLWFLWPNYPELNGLLNASLPLCLIGLCRFTPHFVPVSPAADRLLTVISTLAFLHILALPLEQPLIGQGSFLLLGIIGGFIILTLVLRKVRSHPYARYYALSMIALLLGTLISSLRTIGWVPVNNLTDSAVFLGAAVASLILTGGVGRRMLEERRKRMSSDIRAQQEQRLRARIEKDYDRLLKTHRVTGRPNRAILEETLDALDSHKQPYTLGLIRLERFNEIEQALGYRTAEDLLRCYLRQLNNALKAILDQRLIMVDGHALASIDTANHAFAFLRHEDPASDNSVLGEVMDWLGTTFTEGRFSFSWSPSVGIAHAPEHGDDAAGILSSAGFAALDTAQKLTVYNPSIAEWQYRQQILMLDLEEAINSREMWLEYQPKVSIRDGRVSSLEALIRWHHPEFGQIPPDHWISLAEQVGMIHPVTLWVMDQACQDHTRLRSRYGDDVAIAVNVSAVDLAHGEFHDEMFAIIRRHGMNASDVILEITETAMMADPDAARQMIHRLSRSGFRIALDDFGTGHSSLGTLASFDLDELKIDRSFLRDILRYPTKQRIFRAAFELGEALDLDMVVEGVEEEAIAVWLQQFPGLQGQGYYWGRPEPLRP